MNVGIMQPYFFPYLGYYDLINRTDRWIVFDVVKYTPKSWMNRNRILHPTAGWLYVSVPVKHSEGVTVGDVVLLNKADAHQRTLGQLEHYRNGRAPFFNATRALVDRAFRESPGDKLRDLNLKLPAIEHPGQWALEISTALGVAEYVNPPGGQGLFPPEEWSERGIKLTFTELMDFRYPVKDYTFVERLSVLDVMMWNEPAAIKAFLDEVKARARS
jgi:hypothetical protein